jgi:hypothetical protein
MDSLEQKFTGLPHDGPVEKQHNLFESGILVSVKPGEYPVHQIWAGRVSAAI